jgi:hypothetical protein
MHSTAACRVAVAVPLVAAAAALVRRRHTHTHTYAQIHMHTLYALSAQWLSVMHVFMLQQH